MASVLQNICRLTNSKPNSTSNQVVKSIGMLVGATVFIQAASYAINPLFVRSGDGGFEEVFWVAVVFVVVVAVQIAKSGQQDKSFPTKLEQKLVPPELEGPDDEPFDAQAPAHEPPCAVVEDPSPPDVFDACEDGIAPLVSYEEAEAAGVALATATVNALTSIGEAAYVDLFFNRMRAVGLVPNPTMYTLVVNVCSRKGDANRNERSLNRLVQLGAKADIESFSRLVDDCAKANDIKLTYAVRASYSALVHACVLV